MGGWLTKSNKANAQTNTSPFSLRLKNVSTSPRRTRSPEQLERDEKLRIKKHIQEVLKEDYNWDNLDIHEIVEIFTELLAKNKNQIEIVWKNWRLKSYEKIFIDNLVLWNPSIYEDDVNSIYANYYPCVINQIDGNPIVGYNESSQTWSGMFKLDFLPLEVNDIVAGDGGLLCINGGLQPRTTNPQTPPIPHSEDYNYNLYPQQSILLVCNPLTKEIKYIPRHTNKTLDNKIAWMITMVHPQKNEFNKINPPKHRYRLYVVGSHQDVPTLYGNGCDELVLMAYDSRSDLWIFGSIVGQCRFPESGKTGIAIFDEGFMIGGQEKSIEVTRVDIGKYKKTNLKSNNVNTILDENKTPNLKPRVITSQLWKNKLFFVHRSSLKWHTLDFEILDTEGFPRENLQAPRILQCHPGDTIYVVIRSIIDPSTIEIHEVLMSNGYPSGDFLFVTMMPKDIYNSLFNSEKSLRRYDCCAGLQSLCFLALDDIEDERKVDRKYVGKNSRKDNIKNDVKDNIKGDIKIDTKDDLNGDIKVDIKHNVKDDSKKDRKKDRRKEIKIEKNKIATLAIYNVTTKRWSTLLTPNLNNEGSNSSYALAKCGWNPNWLARP